MQHLVLRGVTEPLAILGEMADAMPSFKRILDTASREAMADLAQRFDGFFLYSKALEWCAAKLASGEIVAPK